MVAMPGTLAEALAQELRFKKIRARLSKKNSKRDPDLENYPYRPIPGLSAGEADAPPGAGALHFGLADNGRGGVKDWAFGIFEQKGRFWSAQG